MINIKKELNKKQIFIQEVRLMARNRLSWDKEKKAELEKKADPYTMNQDHPTQPLNLGK